MDFLKTLGMDAPVIAAGLFGGIISLAFIPKVTVGVALISIFGGGGLAAYLAPAVADYVNLPVGAVGFAIGIFGMNIIGGLFNLTFNFKDKPLETAKSIKSLKDGDS